ncbi:MAG: CBS domain-containing protein [Desulfatitalea sp.]
MKLTQTKKVGEIVRPPIEGVPPAPCVDITDPIMRAIELMLKNDLTQIAVVGCRGLIGHLRLDDALQHLGLYSPTPPAVQGSKTKTAKEPSLTKPR